MCGLAGFAGIKNHAAKINLVVGLGFGIDGRGKDAAGFVSIVDGIPKYCKKLGKWKDARYRFWNTAAKGDICMMHARFATCGKKTIDEAHPYSIWRNKKVVLWGAHNGMMRSAWDCAKEHNRTCSVDSKELFELLADKEYETIKKQIGYGVITWIDSEQRDAVHLIRLSYQSDIYVASIKGGGIVWGSTKSIVEEAVDVANLEIENVYDIKEIGREYIITANEVYYTSLDKIQFASNYVTTNYSNQYKAHTGSYFPYTDTGTTKTFTKSLIDDDDDDLYDQWAQRSSKESKEKSKAKEIDADSSLTDDEAAFLKANGLEELFKDWEEKEAAEDWGDEVDGSFRNFLG